MATSSKLPTSILTSPLSEVLLFGNVVYHSLFGHVESKLVKASARFPIRSCQVAP
jgi:hypothetical protein